VRSGGVPVMNTMVNFTIKKPNRALVTGTAITSNDGTALYKLRLTKKDPLRTYEADGKIASANAATYFIVQ
jgi:hypothetical protein